MSEERQEQEAEAEKVRRGAVRKMALFAVIFVVWQVGYFTIFPDEGAQVRTVDVVRTLAFLAWAAVLLAFFATGGAMFRLRRLRPFLDDERALALRSVSYRAGFWAMVALSMLGYAASLWADLRAADVAHIILSGGILVLLVTQVIEERR